MSPLNRYINTNTRVSASIGALWGGVLSLLVFGGTGTLIYFTLKHEAEAAQTTANQAKASLVELKTDNERRFLELKQDVRDIATDVKALLQRKNP